MLEVALHETAKEKYLNYAYSVISSRALPDVRDGLKPVQRRILYAMFHNLALKPEGRFRKSAAVVGEVMAKYHPHGDSSIYEAMVRMAQPFSLLHPLVEGQGNFGSLDGDNAAAMRYTEAKLQPLALQLVEEIKKGTVEFRPNYDGQHPEPVVLPVRFPQLLVNGSEGIAVGMATRIPTHNLREVLDACSYLLKHPTATNGDLVQIIRGPDFPTGGVILNTPEEIQEIYSEGRGSILLQGTWEVEQKGKQAQIIVTEIPYGVNKALLVEKIGKLIEDKKMPLALDVRDESAEDVRIVIEIKKSSDAEPIMSYLFKYTPLQTVFPVNLTCLVPSRDAERALEPKRCDLRTILRSWLEFRYETVQRRFCHDLQKVQARVHTLEGFEIIFSRMNEALDLIRNKAGKKLAGDALAKRFSLSPEQVEVILETPLYKLSSMEVQGVLEELQAARGEAEAIGKRLGSPAALWGVIHKELQELRKEFGKDRQTEVGKELKKLAVFKGSDLVVSEKTVLYVTREGWVKRQGSFTGLDKAKLREGDSLGWVYKGNTKNTATFFTDAGGAYTIRLADLPSGVGFGEPLQKHFSFADGEKVVGVIVNDGLEEVIAMTRWGRLLRFPLLAHKEPSTKNGRRFAKLETDGDKVLAVYPFKKDLLATALTAEGQALCFPLGETPIVQGAGKGVTGLKLNPSGTDRVLAFEASEKSELVAKTKSGKEETISATLMKRAHTGKPIKGGPFIDWSRKTVLPQDNDNGV